MTDLRVVPPAPPAAALEPLAWDWLNAYRQYCQANEAPDFFHYWCGLAALGHLLNRRVWLDQFYFKLYPGQMMVLLVSPTAIDRKTTAINMVREFLGHMPEDSVNVIVDQLSPATLYDSLERNGLDSIGLLVADELANLLTRERFAESLCTMITQLNTAGDGIQRRRMRTRTVELVNPCLGLLGGTTPKGLAKELPPVALQAGFMGRINIIFDDGANGKVNPLTTAPPNLERLKTALVRDMHRIAALKGPFTWSPEAKTLYEQWYIEHKQNSTTVADDLQTGWFSRKHTHLLRVAMILSCARSSDLVLNAVDIMEARDALDMIQGRIPQASSEIGTTPMTDRAEKMLALIIREGGDHGWIMHRQLAHKSWRWCSPQDAHQALEALVEAGKIEMQRRPGGGRAYQCLRH